MTIVEPAADAASLNSRSPRAGRMSTATSAGFVSGSVTTSTSDQAIALTAVDSLDLNSSGIGMYPLSPRPL